MNRMPHWPGYTASQPRHGHRWINIERRERGVYSRNDVAYLPTPCQQCQDAHCMHAAPDAVTRRADGLVMIDPEKAKGNRKLVDSCPFGAIFWNEEANVAQKCTMCAHLIDDKSWTPGMPRCAHSCPTGAMKFYDMEPAAFEAMASKEGLEGYRADELKNQPHVLYKNFYRYIRNFVTIYLNKAGRNSIAPELVLAWYTHGKTGVELQEISGAPLFPCPRVSQNRCVDKPENLGRSRMLWRQSSCV